MPEIEKCQKVKTRKQDNIMIPLTNNEHCTNDFLEVDSNGICQIKNSSDVIEEEIKSMIGMAPDNDVIDRVASYIKMDAGALGNNTTYIEPGNTTGSSSTQIDNSKMGLDLCIFAQPNDSNDCNKYYNQETGELCTTSPINWNLIAQLNPGQILYDIVTPTIQCTSAARNYPYEDDEIDVFDDYWYAHCSDIPECMYELGSGHTTNKCEDLTYDPWDDSNDIRNHIKKDFCDECKDENGRSCQEIMADLCKSAYNADEDKLPLTCVYNSSGDCEEESKTGRFPWCHSAEPITTTSDYNCHLYGKYYCLRTDQCVDDCNECPCQNINCLRSDGTTHCISNCSYCGCDGIEDCGSRHDGARTHCEETNTCVNSCMESCGENMFICEDPREDPNDFVSLKTYHCSSECSECRNDQANYGTISCLTNGRCVRSCNDNCHGLSLFDSTNNTCVIGPDDCGNLGKKHCSDLGQCVDDCGSECNNLVNCNTNNSCVTDCNECLGTTRFDSTTNTCQLDESDCAENGKFYCPEINSCVNYCGGHDCPNQTLTIGNSCQTGCPLETPIYCSSQRSCGTDCNECLGTTRFDSTTNTCQLGEGDCANDDDKFYCEFLNSCVTDCAGCPDNNYAIGNKCEVGCPLETPIYCSSQRSCGIDCNECSGTTRVNSTTNTCQLGESDCANDDDKFYCKSLESCITNCADCPGNNYAIGNACEVGCPSETPMYCVNQRSCVRRCYDCMNSFYCQDYNTCVENCSQCTTDGVYCPSYKKCINKNTCDTDCYYFRAYCPETNSCDTCIEGGCGTKNLVCTDSLESTCVENCETDCPGLPTMTNNICFP